MRGTGEGAVGRLLCLSVHSVDTEAKGHGSVHSPVESPFLTTYLAVALQILQPPEGLSQHITKARGVRGKGSMGPVKLLTPITRTTRQV